MIVAVGKIVSPDIDAARVEALAAETIADIFGEMNEARLGLFSREIATIKDKLAADRFNVTSGGIDLDAAKPAIPFMSVDTLTDELDECHFVGVEELNRRKDSDRIKARLHANIDAWQIGEFESGKN